MAALLAAIPRISSTSPASNGILAPEANDGWPKVLKSGPVNARHVVWPSGSVRWRIAISPSMSVA